MVFNFSILKVSPPDSTDVYQNSNKNGRCLPVLEENSKLKDLMNCKYTKHVLKHIKANTDISKSLGSFPPILLLVSINQPFLLKLPSSYFLETLCPL